MTENGFEIIDDNRLLSYVKEYLLNRNIDSTILQQGGKITVTVNTDDDIFIDMVADIVLNFYKLSIILEKINFGRTPTLSECAFLGATLSLEKDIEKEKIIVLAEKTDIRNIEGFYNFCLCGMRDNWTNLALLSKRLLSQCKCDKDIYSLTGFMLGIDDNIRKNVVVDYPILLRGADNSNIEVIQFFDDLEKNVIMAIMAQNPSDILVMDSQKVSKKFMQVIQALGE
ncbi:hypothetical protein EOM82_05580 [bacterium]|nr:hypothetical protein [bacterium]